MLSAFQKLTRRAHFIEYDENGARLYERKRGYKQALKDFYSLKPVDVIDNPMVCSCLYVVVIVFLYKIRVYSIMISVRFSQNK